MRLLITLVEGTFDDLTELDPGTEADARRSIGRHLVERRSRGAITRWPEVPGARFLSVFDGAVLGTTIQGAHYRFVWDGARIKPSMISRPRPIRRYRARPCSDHNTAVRRSPDVRNIRTGWTWPGWIRRAP